MGIFLVAVKKNMASVETHMFYRVKKDWVFVSSQIKGMKMLNWY